MEKINIVEKFNGKKVILWGYGAEGKCAENFLEKYCSTASITVYEGDYTGLNIEDCDYVIKSPGVPYIYTDEPKFTSLTELFLEEFGQQTIGITGTKGKSTTTSMLYKTLADNLDRKVCLLGNIGIPCLDAYEDMKNGALAVYEMSCHQLANNVVSPHIAIFLNLFEDHLDYYKTRDNYFKAKAHIAYYQGEGDYLFAGESVPQIDTRAKRIDISSDIDVRFDLKILGEHNQWNAKVVSLVATKVFGCDEKKVRSSIENFEGLPHRLERFANIDGVTYYDDSISTIPEATLTAIESVCDTKTVIVGGMDRGIEYDILIDGIKNISDVHFILCYASGKRIYDSVKACDNVSYVEDLKAAVALAKKITKNGSCILSPAAASYGYFKNFAHRGDCFKEMVNE